jgi:predicted PurR-regulated permease PerM
MLKERRRRRLHRCPRRYPAKDQNARDSAADVVFRNDRSGDASTTINIVWTIYLIVAGMADNVLKPLLLGRGVEAPMLVILIGAMGGMVSAGIIGLFLGAVLLAVGYKVFMVWVNDDEEGTSTEPD